MLTEKKVRLLETFLAMECRLSASPRQFLVKSPIEATNPAAPNGGFFA